VFGVSVFFAKFVMVIIFKELRDFNFVIVAHYFE
jgi:hypothetical protein